MKICVIGLGYIGLPTAAMFAYYGADVIGVDINQYAIDTINKGKIHIVEPGLEAIVKEVIESGKMKASLTPEKSDAYIIAVPTPFKGDDYTPDLSYIKAVSKVIAPIIKKGDIVILESTSPVGTTEQLVEWLKEERQDLTFPSFLEPDDEKDIFVAYCPERVLPGNVINELVSNARIIGGITKESTNRAKEVYRIFVKGDLLETNSRTAEMAKLTENAYRDVNIAFANELSIISDKLGINVWELIVLANKHPRVNILQPGCGVGGHCIAVDPWFIVNKTPDLARLIHTARLVNDDKPNWVIGKVNETILTILKENPNKQIKDIRIACLGLAFKPDIDDLRESPALKITKKLAEMYQGQVSAVEPNISKLPNTVDGARIQLINLSQIHIDKYDILLLLVNHKEFLYDKIRKTKAKLIDVRGNFAWL